MKIRITSGVILSGEPCDKGFIVEVSDNVARQIIASNRAVAYVEPEPEPEAPKATATRASK